MTTSSEDQPRCRVCGNTDGWHTEMSPLHPFTGADESTAGLFGRKLADGTRSPAQIGKQAEVVEQQWPFDPVLRQALIDKGVITPDDLSNAERTIRAVTAQWARVQNGGSDVQG